MLVSVSVCCEGERVDLSSSEVHTVASLLKLYLRELPEPIFTFHLGPLFDEAVGESL